MSFNKNIHDFADLKNDSGIRDFIELAAVAISFLDKDATIIYANKTELELLGYHYEEYVGKKFNECHGIDNNTSGIFNKLSNHQLFTNDECVLKRKDGTGIEVLISSTDYYKDGNFLYSMLISRDISRLKKIEKLSNFLKRASEQLTRTHETDIALTKILEFIVPDFADWFTIDLLTSDGRVELAKMAHSDPEKIAWAKKYREMHPVDMKDTMEGSIAWVVRTGKSAFFPVITDELVDLTAKTKEEADVLKNLSLKSAITIPLKSNDKVIGVVSFISTKSGKYYDQVDLNFAEDFANRIAITLENSRLYEDIRTDINAKIAANKQKDDFLAIASHELKTPLTSIKGYIHILTNLIRKGEEIASLNILKKTERQINKMTKLIHNFLDISRLESSKLLLDKESFDLNELVSETINYYNLPENKERLRFQAGNIPMVVADRSKISQVIDNYLSNALKYSAPDELVILKTTQENNHIIVSVSDRGIGIDENSKNKIFQRFFRADNMKNATASGFGIGLYLSVEIVKLHHGNAWFDSEEGKGSVFYFSLPLN